MGYTTDFSGSLSFNKPVASWLEEYINKFSETRRMKRDPEKIKELYPDWGELCFNGELGDEGQYFIGVMEILVRAEMVLLLITMNLLLVSPVCGVSGLLKIENLSGTVERSSTTMKSGLII